MKTLKKSKNCFSINIRKLSFLSFFLLFINTLCAQNVLRYELGIHRPNLSWAGTLSEEKLLLDKMNEMGAKSVRLNPTSMGTVTDFIEHVKYANQLGMKVNMEISITAFPEFYPLGTTKRPVIGIWGPRYRFSDMVPDNIKVWAATVFDQMKAAGAQIELVEFGNESNWIDFNGDLPYIVGGKFYDYSSEWNDPTYIKIREGFSKYGMALKKIREELNRVWGNDTVKLITNGSVAGYHLTSWAQTNGGSILSTAVMLDLLQGTHPELPANSTNYLNEADGIGIHLYPKVIELNFNQAKESVANEIRTIMNPIVDVVGEDIPVWVTEWDYPKSLFNNDSETDRYTMLKNFLAVCQALPYNWQKFYLFTFDQGSHKIYENGQFLPGSQIFTDYQYNKNAWDLDSVAYKIQNADSDLCLRGYDPNALNKDGNDSYITMMNNQTWSTLNWYLKKVPNEPGIYRLKNEHTGLYMRGYDPVTLSASSKIVQNSLEETSSTLKWRVIPSLYEGEFHIQGIYGGNYIWSNSTTNNSYPTLISFNDTLSSMRWKLNGISPSLSIITSSENLMNRDRDVILFPNPVSKDLNFSLSSNLKTKISIYNSLGVLVYENNFKSIGNHRIIMSHLNSGIYMVKISDGKQMTVKKIIKR
ncbi:MAG: T9SS type A sorting domain-containing protein [Gelidibacter sp.]|nr:T9SS type A sorting domain-containing protein [Gelidibacter sp.]